MSKHKAAQSLDYSLSITSTTQDGFGVLFDFFFSERFSNLSSKVCVLLAGSVRLIARHARRKAGIDGRGQSPRVTA